VTQEVSFFCSRSLKAIFSTMAMRRDFNFFVSMVSSSNVHSVEMDFCSLYWTIGVKSTPFALLCIAIPYLPNALMRNFRGILRSVAKSLTPISWRNVAVCGPMPGIFSTASGPKKSRSVPAGISFWALGLNSAVVIFDTVLLTDIPNEIGSPLSRKIFFCNCIAHWKAPKNRSIPLASM
jgi:hypothetical protein